MAIVPSGTPVRVTGSATGTGNISHDAGTASDRVTFAAVIQRTPTLQTSSATFNGSAMTAIPVEASETSLSTDLRASLFYIINPPTGSSNCVVSFGGSVQYEVHVFTFGGIAQTSPLDDYDTFTSPASTAPTISLTPTEDNELLLGVCVHEGAAALTTGSGETVILSQDNGAWVVHSEYAVQTTATTQSIDWTNASELNCAAVAASFKAAGGTAPTVALNSPADAATGVSVNVGIQFTGTDAETNPITYQVQISTTPDFTGGSSLLQDTFSGGGGLTIHAQPTGGTTWNSTNQTDDRTGQSFTADGGVLDKISIHASNDQGLGSYPNGVGRIMVYVHDGTFGTSSAPLNAADPADTPTPGWLAISDEVTFSSTMSSTMGWYDFTFSGANRIQLQAGTKYLFSFDWRPADTYINNMFAVYGDANNSGTLHGGNLYIDGASTNNNGVQATWDLWFRVYEVGTLIDKLSDTDTGFSGSPDNTDPFTSGQQVTYTVQAGDTLVNSTKYYWRVRGKDPAGTNSWGAWTTARSFTTAAASNERNATLSKTLENATLVSTATLDISGTLSKTLANVSLVSTATLEIMGVLAKTLENATLVSTATIGSNANAGTLSVTLANATLVATSTLELQGSLTQTLANATLAATATIGDVLSPISGTLTQTLANATLGATGTLLIAGVTSATLANATLASTATLEIEGVVSKTLANATLTSTGTVTISGVVAKTLDNVSLTSTGTLRIAGSVSKTLANATLTATGRLMSPISGVLSKTLANATLVATGVKIITGTPVTPGHKMTVKRQERIFEIPSSDRVTIIGSSSRIMEVK